MKKEKKLISKKEFYKKINLKIKKIQAFSLLILNVASIIFMLYGAMCYFDIIAKNTACNREPLASWNYWQKVENAYYQNLPEKN